MSPSQRRAVVWLAALIGIGITLKAGFWQLGRAEEKRVAHERMLAQRTQPPWRGMNWPCRAASNASDAPDASAALPLDKPVRLRGHWLQDKTVFLDNRPMDGMSGFVVVTPLALLPADAAPACQGRVLLVERGWVPRDMNNRQHLPALPSPTGEVTVSGRVTAGLTRTFQLGSEALVDTATRGPLLRQNADVAFWRQWLGQAPLAGAVLQVQAEETTLQMPDNVQQPQQGTLRRNWPEPGTGRDKHLAYAAQWFAMAALIAGLTIWFQIIRPHRRASSHVPS